MSSAPSLDGRRFAGVSNSGDGEVGQATVFDHHESDGLVRAEYSGGAVRLGRLAGVRDGDVLRFRYVHVSADGTSGSGRCEARLEVLDDGRVRSHETWAWESRPGTGESVVEEVTGRT
ncbi:hypothetical protein WHI96_01905 [Pseudonocardia tropica]|uniref:Nuclear transport factor 2 family protein n=1 Tax=Pseudonocardia tropica TaxID=681289 RepID=A0ABV1JNQ1_9PSEU